MPLNKNIFILFDTRRNELLNIEPKTNIASLLFMPKFFSFLLFFLLNILFFFVWMFLGAGRWWWIHCVTIDTRQTVYSTTFSVSVIILNAMLTVLPIVVLGTGRNPLSFLLFVLTGEELPQIRIRDLRNQRLDSRHRPRVGIWRRSLMCNKFRLLHVGGCGQMTSRFLSVAI